MSERMTTARRRWPWRSGRRADPVPEEPAETTDEADAAGEPELELPDPPATDEEPWPDDPADGRSQVDICFVFDTTGSMSDKIDGLTRCMVEFVGALAELALNWRITAVPFGDLTVKGDRVVGDLPFVNTRAQAEDMLRTLPRFS